MNQVYTIIRTGKQYLVVIPQGYYYFSKRNVAERFVAALKGGL